MSFAGMRLRRAAAESRRFGNSAFLPVRPHFASPPYSHHAPTKLLFRVWDKNHSPSLASLDKPSILRHLRATFATGAVDAALSSKSCDVWFGVDNWSGNASGAATISYSPQREFAAVQFREREWSWHSSERRKGSVTRC